jgi:hypothetical protein
MDNRLREPRKKTCIDSNFIWLWETYTFSNQLLCTKNGFEMNFYANYLLDIFYPNYTPKFASCCVFLQTPLKRTPLLSGHLGEVPKVSA